MFPSLSRPLEMFPNYDNYEANHVDSNVKRAELCPLNLEALI